MVDPQKEYAKAPGLLVEYRSKVRPREESSVLDARSSKNARISNNSSNPLKEPEPSISLPSVLDKDKPNNNPQKLKVDSDDGHDKESNSEKSKSQFVKDSSRHEKGISTKKDDEKKAKPFDNTLHEAASLVALKDNKTDGQIVEVSRRPDAVRHQYSLVFASKRWMHSHFTDFIFT